MPKTPNKKQIFLDVDGVLLDFHTNFSLYLKEKHSIELSSAVENYHTNSVLKKGEKDAKQLKLEKFFQQKNVMEDFFVSDYFSTLNALIDIHSYNQIAQKYPTYLLTNLSEKRKLAREKNLKLHGFSYQKIFFAGFDKYGDPNYPLKSKIILQKTRASVEAIYLMMKRVFDEMGYRRFEWKCDSLNKRSCEAARKFGFQFEGIFRQLTIYKGRNRDTAWFSIIDKDWKRIKQNFEKWLDEKNFDESGNPIISLRALSSNSI